MPDTRLALTDRSIGGLPFAVSSQYFARDTEPTREARAEAKELLGKIAKGIDPREKNPQLDVAESQPGGISFPRGGRIYFACDKCEQFFCRAP